MKFEHLEFTEKEFKDLDLQILKIESIWKKLENIQKKRMKKYHHCYNWRHLWYEVIEKRCVLCSNGSEVLVHKSRYDEIISIYKEDNDYMGFYHIKEYNPIGLMYLRNEVSEC